MQKITRKRYLAIMNETTIINPPALLACPCLVFFLSLLTKEDSLCGWHFFQTYNNQPLQPAGLSLPCVFPLLLKD